MSIIATSAAEFKKEPIPAGNYIARCYQMIEIGHVKESYMGEEKIQAKIRIGWELPTELKVFNPEKGEQPLVISKELTLSMHEKSNMRKMLKSWRGKDFSEEEAKNFDVTKLLGTLCMLNITHKEVKDNMYAEISSISVVPKGMTIPKAVNPVFVLSYDKWDEDKFKSLPDFIKAKMMTSQEYAKLKYPSVDEVNTQTEEFSFTENDLPF